MNREERLKDAFLTSDTYVEGDDFVTQEELDADLAEGQAHMKEVRAKRETMRTTTMSREMPTESAAVAALLTELLDYADTHSQTEEETRMVEGFRVRSRALIRNLVRV